MTELESAVLRWHRARHAMVTGCTLVDATSKLIRLEDPTLIPELAAAESALNDMAAKMEPRASCKPQRSHFATVTYWPPLMVSNHRLLVQSQPSYR